MVRNVFSEILAIGNFSLQNSFEQIQSELFVGKLSVEKIVRPLRQLRP